MASLIRTAACGLAISCGVLRAASAQQSCDTSPTQIPTLLTVEGGGSLGVYEAGVTFALVETFKRKWLGESHPTFSRLPPFCLAIATGASAGSINAFIAATNWCDARVSSRPEASMLWRVWITTGIMQLLPVRGEDPTPDNAVFARRHFDEYIEPRLKEWWKGASWIPDCHVEFGATATRLYADSLSAVGGITARNQRLAFALTVQGVDSTVGEPIVRQFLPELRMQRGSFGSLNTLPATRGDTVQWRDVFTLLKVSSAFPVAFEPLELQYCAYEESARVGTPSGCGKTGVALDGGVFDNAPLSLSYALSFSHNRTRTATTMLFLSPDRPRIWYGGGALEVAAESQRQARMRPHGLETLAQLAGEMIPTARQYELQIAGRVVPMELFLRLTGEQRFVVKQQGSMVGTEARPDSVADVVRLVDEGFRATTRWHPVAGDWLGGFGAFLGRPLREYDFHVGMYDALVLVAENLLCDPERVQAYFAKASGAGESLRGCVARELWGLIANPPIPMGDVAPRVLAALYHDEFTRPRGAAPLARVVASPLTSADSTFLVIDGVREALHAVRGREAREEESVSWYHPEAFLLRKHCIRHDLGNAAFCGSKVVAFFDSLRNDREANRIVQHWSRAADCSVTNDLIRGAKVRIFTTNAWRRPDSCRVERTFAQMANDPEGHLYEMSRQVLSRLEEQTPARAVSGKASGALYYLHASLGDRHRRNSDIGRSTIPLHAKWRPLFYALPSSWGLTPNIRGLGEIGWEARRHIRDWPLTLTFPLRVRPLSQIGNENQRDHTLVIPGVRLEHKALPLATRFGVQTDFWLRPSDPFTHWYRGETTGLYLSMFGKFNVTFTPIPRGLPTYRRQNSTILTIGLGDLNGLLYWAVGKQD
jgi:hypothetical protein